MKLNKQGFAMKSGRLSLLLLTLIVTLFVSSCGGEETKTYRVGILQGISLLTDVGNGFKEGMAELGYVEGENITYDVQTTEFDIPTYQNILNQFVEDEVDLILVMPTEASIEAKAITADTGIPVLFTFALIEGMGIVDSVQEPGGNISGVRYPGPDIAILRYEMMRDLVPDMKNVLLPYQAGYPIVQPQLDALYESAAVDGVNLIEVPANSPEELATYLSEMPEEEVESINAILMLIEPLATVPEAYAALANFGETHQIPMGGFYLPSEGYGSFFGVNVDFIETGRLAAPLADKIFNGIEAGTLPVVSSDPYIEIDYNMMQQMGLEAPDSLLARAEKVYR